MSEYPQNTLMPRDQIPVEVALASRRVIEAADGGRALHT